jgi:hypothetical protein
MPFVDDIGAFLNRNRGYFFGKVLLMFAVGAASTALNISIFWPALLIVGGGMAIHAYGRFTEHRYYQQEMVDLYRDDIAQHLGIAPEQVTRAHLKEAANGNEVIAQALQRQHKKLLVDMGTSLLAGAVTFGLLLTFGNAGQFFEFTKDTFKALGPLVNLIGLGAVSGISGLVLHDVLGLAIGAKVGTIKAAAHDLIVDMHRDIERGRPISREQVYGVLVASNPDLQQAIATRFHKSYAWMSAAEKSNVLHEVGVATDMDILARQINTGEIRPGRLAYMLADATLPAQRAASDSNTASPAQEPQKSNFVGRLGLAARANSSFTEQVKESRSHASGHAL